MTTYYYKDVPEYYMSKFKAVRSSLDNFYNALQLAEIVNVCQDCLVSGPEEGFDIAIFTHEARRFLIKKVDGYTSFSIPFQIVTNGDDISFNCDMAEESISGKFISIMKNAITSFEQHGYSHEEAIVSIMDNYDLDILDATLYYDAFVSMLSEDHGYFRFDDDPARANADIHPRYHFDIFYKDSTSIKLGYKKHAELDCFLSMFDKELPKLFLT